MPSRILMRPLAARITDAVGRYQPLMHIIVGARQTGKSTISEQIAAGWQGPAVAASADLPVPPGPEWITMNWIRAREAASGTRKVLLVLDEIQKVRGWSDAVKGLWEEDKRNRIAVRPLLLGSSSMLMQRGLTESLAGRFMLHRCPHWTYPECRDAFRWGLDRWLYFGGYPGAAKFAHDQPLWRIYVADSLVEPAIARDVLSMERITKPALLRQLFNVAAQYPAHILSYTKMLATLQDAGNTVTLAHYCKLMEHCFLLSGLDRITGRARKRGSIPKLIIWNNALVTALSGIPYDEARRDGAFWGHLVENAVGAHLLNHLHKPNYTVGYWREKNDEVDFVVTHGRKTVAIEVKSARPGKLAGLDAYLKRTRGAKPLVVGAGGIPLEEFFSADPARYIERA